MNHRPTPVSAAILLGAVLLAVMLGAQRIQADTSAKQDLAAVWQRVHLAGAYRFSADIEQTTTPQASLANAGRESKRTSFYMEGATDLAAESLHLSVWTAGGSVLAPETGLEVRITGDTAEARQGNGPWQEIENFTGLFAPGGDFLTYTRTAKNVINHGMELRSTVAGEFLVTRYTFDIDGRRMAERVRAQMTEQAIAGGLPATIQLELPKVYADMTGTGELWVGADGMPLRQRFALQFPEDQHNYQASAGISVDFADFAPLRSGAGSGMWPGAVRVFLYSVRSAVTLQSSFGIFWLAALSLLAALIVLRRRSRTVYAGVVLAVIGSMLFAPLLNSRQVYAFGARQAAQAATRAPSQTESDLELALAEPSFEPNSDPLLVAQAQEELADDDGEAFHDPLCASDPDGDADGDTLTNISECLLGTLLDSADSAQDDVPDNIEVAGYQYKGRTWYSDPLKLDTNNDSLSDGREWLLGPDGSDRPQDTNGNGVPDLWDDDNDGDGVRDKLDLSPYASTHPGGPDAQVFTEDAPFELVLDDLLAGQLTKVEFQLVPTNPDHLWYTQNVLDWPFQDQQGQLQDADGATFYDVEMGVPPSPNANGDVRMVPMLEIEISGPETNLPPASTCTNDAGNEVTCYPLLEKFGIGVREIVANETYAAYVPLQLVTDNTGDRNVAFYGRMLYQASGLWESANRVRMVWAVQMLNDVCAVYEDNVCVQYRTMNEPQIVQVYADDWYLSGLHVTEEHGADLALIYGDRQLVLWRHRHDHRRYASHHDGRGDNCETGSKRYVGRLGAACFRHR